MKKIIHHSEIIYKCFEKINLPKKFRGHVLKHIMAILVAAFCAGYRGKTVDMAESSGHHRTTIGHFLNGGKWDDVELANVKKRLVVEKIYQEAMDTGQAIYVIVDDTISSVTKPSSRASHPIEDAYFHQSHLKKKQDYGHQVVCVMLSCNGLVLNYDLILYDKSKTKIEIVQEIAGELPIAPVVGYLLCDSWYTSKKVIDAFLLKGFYTIGAIRTNRVIYPCGIKKKINEFALFMEKTDRVVRLVTVGSRQYYVYRYEGKLNGIDDAVVLITYPKDAFHDPKALRAFISTDTSLSTDEILALYSERWPIEVFFRQTKNVLAIDKYQIRSANGIKRFWLIMSLAHLFCCTLADNSQNFANGFSFFRRELAKERISFIYLAKDNNFSLDDLFALLA